MAVEGRARVGSAGLVGVCGRSLGFCFMEILAGGPRKDGSVGVGEGGGKVGRRWGRGWCGWKMGERSVGGRHRGIWAPMSGAGGKQDKVGRGGGEMVGVGEKSGGKVGGPCWGD